MLRGKWKKHHPDPLPFASARLPLCSRWLRRVHSSPCSQARVSTRVSLRRWLQAWTTAPRDDSSRARATAAAAPEAAEALPQPALPTSAKAVATPSGRRMGSRSRRPRRRGLAGALLRRRPVLAFDACVSTASYCALDRAFPRAGPAVKASPQSDRTLLAEYCLRRMRRQQSLPYPRRLQHVALVWSIAQSLTPMTHQSIIMFTDQ